MNIAISYDICLSGGGGHATLGNRAAAVSVSAAASGRETSRLKTEAIS